MAYQPEDPQHKRTIEELLESIDLSLKRLVQIMAISYETIYDDEELETYAD